MALPCWAKPTRKPFSLNNLLALSTASAPPLPPIGDHGLRLSRLARGEDHRRVNPVSDRKSVSAETTFNTDISDLEQLKDKLWQVSLKTADRSKAKNLAGRTVTLKLKTAQFKSISRRRTLQQPVQLADVIFSELEPLLEAEVDGHKSYRLIGAGISGLSAPVGDVADMLDLKSAKRGAAERASDIARAKFGPDAVTTGRGLRLRQAKAKNSFGVLRRSIQAIAAVRTP